MCFIGGVLGFHCEHHYAHTNNNYIRRLPLALKGMDGIIYTILSRAFRICAYLRPILMIKFDLNHTDLDSGPGEDGDIIGTRLHEVISSHQGDSEGVTAESVRIN